MSSLQHYFSNAAAVISYAPAGYIRLDWQAAPATAPELRAIYEHVLRAMIHHRSPTLMTVHNRRPPMSAEVQTWLTQEWIPRAVATVGYGRCAIVQAEMPLSRLAAHAVGSGQKTTLRYRYFDDETAADSWLREA
ncbi:hypothetical protein [Hymenobacter negativus]|uniref:STAS/SEC14 domain-containing protein n=1 Tax=Hymenobacter negativus TaxID=2795026 RepID=A0ABS3QKK0_9BACT|nr:hypothetical protein [Hymenobacter negativus]MBO2011513.1 hypothetical protein [Hymenobacter negativus]